MKRRLLNLLTALSLLLCVVVEGLRERSGATTDTLRAPLGVLWFGGSSHDAILPRHGHGPQPQVVGGRILILGMDLLVETDEIEQDVSHRAARLYRFDENKYRRLVKRGFNFEI